MMEVKLPLETTTTTMPPCTIVILTPIEQPEKWIECFNSGEFIQLFLFDGVPIDTEFEVFIRDIHVFETSIDPHLHSLSSFDEFGTMLEHTPGEEILVSFHGEGLFIFV